MKNKLKRLLVAAIALCIIIGISPVIQTQAAVKLSATQSVVGVGRNLTIKIIEADSAKWSVSNGHIKIMYKTDSYVRIKGVSSGISYLKAKVNGKMHKCKISVDKWPKPDGSRANPYDAFNSYTSNVYYFGKMIGKFKIKLLDYKDGEDAQEYMDALRKKDNDFYYKANRNQEFVCMKFKIKYISGDDEVFLGNIINRVLNFDAKKSVRRSVVIDELPGNIKNMEQISAAPGESVTCMSISIVKKGNTPITYNIETESGTRDLFIIQ